MPPTGTQVQRPDLRRRSTLRLRTRSGALGQFRPPNKLTVPHQDPAVPAPVRPGPPHHPRQTQDPQNPARLGMGPRPDHCLGTPASPAPRLTSPPPTRPTSTTRPNRGTRRPPEHHRDYRHTQNRHLRRPRPKIQTIMELWISVNDPERLRLGPPRRVMGLVGMVPVGSRS